MTGLKGVGSKGWEEDDKCRGETGYPVKLWVNIMKTKVPQTIQFNTCQVLICEDLEARCQLTSENKYLCPENQEKLHRGLPCPGWSNVMEQHL